MRLPRMPLAIIVAGVMSGCGGTTNEVSTSPKIEQYRIVRIAVLPFTVTPKTLGQGRGYAEPAPPLVASEKLAELFYMKLNAREGIVVVPPRTVQGAMPALLAAVSPAQLRELGERLNVGAVLEGTVEVYKERKGSAIGLDRPEDAAEVGFTVRLVSVKDGEVLWTGDYYERQRPMIEDISGFLERGARYLRVEQLADSAVDHVLRGFPLGKPMKTKASVTETAP
jgi:TolB-like protein